MRTIAAALLAALLLTGCVFERDYPATLVLYSSSEARYELARYKMWENCAKSAAMWQAQAEGDVRFTCEG